MAGRYRRLRLHCRFPALRISGCDGVLHKRYFWIHKVRSAWRTVCLKLLNPFVCGMFRNVKIERLSLDTIKNFHSCNHLLGKQFQPDLVIIIHCTSTTSVFPGPSCNYIIAIHITYSSKRTSGGESPDQSSLLESLQHTDTSNVPSAVQNENRIA